MINIDEVSYKRAKFRQAGLEAASGGDTAASDAANASEPGRARISTKSGFEVWSEKLLHGCGASFRYAVSIPLASNCSWTQMNASYASIKSAEAGLN